MRSNSEISCRESCVWCKRDRKSGMKVAWEPKRCPVRFIQEPLIQKMVLSCTHTAWSQVVPRLIRPDGILPPGLFILYQINDSQSERK